MPYSMLIVDDERIERKGIESLVARFALPIDCRTAENGQTALRLLEGQRFDLLLTDIKMPFMDGLTLAHEARKRDPEMVIIILSAYRDFEKAQSAIDEQVYRYLLKPVEMHAFRDLMQSCLDLMDRRTEEERKRSQMEEDLRTYRRMEARLRSTLREDGDTLDRDLVLDLLPGGQEGPSGTGADSPAVRQTLQIIRREYMNDLSLEEIADRVGLHYSYLSTLFHQQTGQSFVRYLNSYRLEIAAQMLREGHVKVSEAAARVGFQRDSYFISSFKARFGLTPRAYSIQMGNKE